MTKNYLKLNFMAFKSLTFRRFLPLHLEMTIPLGLHGQQNLQIHDHWVHCAVIDQLSFSHLNNINSQLEIINDVNTFSKLFLFLSQ